MENEETSELSNENDSENYKQKLRKEEIDIALKKICKDRKLWLYFMFFIAAFPGVLNGMHLISYVFYIDNEPHYCYIPELERAGWTPQQIRNVSLPNIKSADLGCEFYNYDYSRMAANSYELSIDFVKKTSNFTKLLPCNGNRFSNNDSVISEWNLVCDRFILRSNIQAAYAIGKFVGGSFFGTMSDKYGRRFGFTMASLCYVISALLSPFSGVYSVFLFARFLIGMSGVGCYGTVYTLLTEILIGPTKTWICCAFNLSYPVGMIMLSFIAYHFQYWKTLQILISIPTVVLPFYFWLLPESPQWLLSKNRFDEAWNVIRNIDPTLYPVYEGPTINLQKSSEELRKISLIEKLVLPFAKFKSLFSTSTLTLRSLVCFFSWFTVATTYFGLSMNNQNFAVNRYLYTVLNAVLEMISYILPIYLLSICGRKTSSILLYALTGVSLISIMFIPKSYTTFILVIALFGRFCDSSVYVILPLFTSELFPTSIRNTAIGASSTMSHTGTFVSPYITDLLGAYKWYIPSTIFGSLCLCTICLLVLLPETKNKPSFNTIEEMDLAVKTKFLLKKRQTDL